MSRSNKVGVLKASDDVEKFLPAMGLRAAFGAGKKLVGQAGKKLMGNIKATPKFLANQMNPLQNNNNSPATLAFDALSRTADSNKAANQQMTTETRNLARTGAGTSGTGTQGA
jgi:hypothetical protein